MHTRISEAEYVGCHMIKVKPLGHIPGGSPTVPRSDYAAIVLLSELFSWTRHDIGELWGIKPISVRTIIRRWKAE